MNFLCFLVLYIGTFPSVLNAEPDFEELEKNGLVYVEPNHVSQVRVDGEYKLEPYTKRRKTWGVTFSIGYSTYEPINMEPSYSQFPYDEVYGKPTLGMLEGRFGVKRNMDVGSLAFEVIAGGMTNDNTDENFVGSKLTINPVHIGAAFYLDSMGDEPYLVPYVSGGGYVMIFKETLYGNTDRGSTMIAPYVSGGLALQLDWIDRRAARISFEDSGIQSSYIYGEARSYFASSSKKDPDFSNNVTFNGGVRVEF